MIGVLTETKCRRRQVFWSYYVQPQRRLRFHPREISPYPITRPSQVIRGQYFVEALGAHSSSGDMKVAREPYLVHYARWDCRRAHSKIVCRKKFNWLSQGLILLVLRGSGDAKTNCIFSASPWTKETGEKGCGSRREGVVIPRSPCQTFVILWWGVLKRVLWGTDATVCFVVSCMCA